MGHWSSLALDGAGNPIIAYRDSMAGDLKIARCTDADCEDPATINIVDDATNVGLYPSLALGYKGYQIIAYYDDENDNLLLAACNDFACATPPTPTVVDSGGEAGSYLSMVLDGSGFPVISSNTTPDTVGGVS